MWVLPPHYPSKSLSRPKVKHHVFSDLENTADEEISRKLLSIQSPSSPLGVLQISKTCSWVQRVFIRNGAVPGSSCPQDNFF